MSNIQAIVRKSNTVAMTFTSKPDLGLIQRLKTAGYKYENGNWFKSQSDSQLVALTDVEHQLTA